MTDATETYEIEIRKLRNSAKFLKTLKDDQKVNKKIAVLLDFDGVLVGDFEHKIYDIEDNDESPGQKKQLKEACAVFDIRDGVTDNNYQRHLVYQAAALELGLPIEGGPYLKVAKWCDENDIVWFVVTARSGIAAVKRLYNFLNDNSLRPFEVYDIGRVLKTQQLKLILGKYDSEYHVDKVYFVDDDLEALEKIKTELESANFDKPQDLILIAAKSSKTTGAEKLILLKLCYETIQRGQAVRAALSDWNTHKSALEHSWNHFYHYANQRLTTFRYMLLVFAVLVGGFVKFATEDPPNYIYLLAMGVSGFALTLLFWGLDYRNEQLVHTSEDGLIVGERELDRKLGKPEFKIIERTNVDGFVTYHYIMRLTFNLFLALSFGAASVSLRIISAGAWWFYIGVAVMALIGIAGSLKLWTSTRRSNDK